jgi:hypothetical protein
MEKNRRLVLLTVLAGGVLLAFVAFLVARWWKAADKPLGEAPLAEVPKTEMTQSGRERFLAADFIVLKDVRALPQPVLQLFTEKGGSRLLMANPGNDFNATDVIYDASVPRKRLIFAGVSGTKCFVFYEQGGLAHMYILAFFALPSKGAMQPLWRGYCVPVANFQDLRSRVRNGQCSEPVPQGMLR